MVEDKTALQEITKVPILGNTCPSSAEDKDSQGQLENHKVFLFQSNNQWQGSSTTTKELDTFILLMVMVTWLLLGPSPQKRQPNLKESSGLQDGSLWPPAAYSGNHKSCKDTRDRRRGNRLDLVKKLAWSNFNVSNHSFFLHILQLMSRHN